jgi:hypothetical protein
MNTATETHAALTALVQDSQSGSRRALGPSMVFEALEATTYFYAGTSAQIAHRIFDGASSTQHAKRAGAYLSTLVKHGCVEKAGKGWKTTNTGREVLAIQVAS